MKPVRANHGSPSAPGFAARSLIADALVARLDDSLDAEELAFRARRRELRNMTVFSAGSGSGSGAGFRYSTIVRRASS